MYFIDFLFSEIIIYNMLLDIVLDRLHWLDGWVWSLDQWLLQIFKVEDISKRNEILRAVKVLSSLTAHSS